MVGLEYTDSGLSPHDVLQEFKTHPFIRRLLEGGERVAWGAKTIPSGGFHSIPDTLALPGAVLTGDSAGLVNIPRLKGVHYAMHSGILAAETIHRALQAGADLAEPGALEPTTRRCARAASAGPAPRTATPTGALEGPRRGRPDRGPHRRRARRVPCRPFGQRDDAEVEMAPRGRRPSSPTAC